MKELRDRSTTVWTIITFISVISFIHHLRLVVDAGQFLLNEAKQIRTLSDVILLAGWALHGTIEIYRQAQSYLISFLPFVLPLWMKDALSAFCFAFGRGLARYRRVREDAKRLEAEEETASKVVRQRISLPELFPLQLPGLPQLQLPKGPRLPGLLGLGQFTSLFPFPAIFLPSRARALAQGALGFAVVDGLKVLALVAAIFGLDYLYVAVIVGA